MLKRLTIAGVSALVLAACADMPTETAIQEVDLMMAAAPAQNVAVCHVGHKADDEGIISLLLVPQKVADRHLDNDTHTFDGVRDYTPGDGNGATGVGQEDTDGNNIDEGCEIPDPEPPTACIDDLFADFEARSSTPWNWFGTNDWTVTTNDPLNTRLTASPTIDTSYTIRITIRGGMLCQIIQNSPSSQLLAEAYPYDPANWQAAADYLIGLIPTS